jgi:hypothetical protein
MEFPRVPTGPDTDPVIPYLHSSDQRLWPHTLSEGTHQLLRYGKSWCRYSLIHFGVSSIKILRLANTRKTGLWESRASKNRNTKTMCANPFWDFAYQDFTICEDKTLASRYPGCQNTEISRFSMLYFSGTSQVRSSGDAMTRGLTSGSSGSRTLNY